MATATEGPDVFFQFVLKVMEMVEGVQRQKRGQGKSLCRQ